MRVSKPFRASTLRPEQRHGVGAHIRAVGLQDSHIVKLPCVNYRVPLNGIFCKNNWLRKKKFPYTHLKILRTRNEGMYYMMKNYCLKSISYSFT